MTTELEEAKAWAEDAIRHLEDGQPAPRRAGPEATPMQRLTRCGARSNAATACPRARPATWGINGSPASSA